MVYQLITSVDITLFSLMVHATLTMVETFKKLYIERGDDDRIGPHHHSLSDLEPLPDRPRKKVEGWEKIFERELGPRFITQLSMSAE